MEIYVNGEWGTITHDRTDSRDARVVCRQLGYDIRCELAENMCCSYNKLKTLTSDKYLWFWLVIHANIFISFWIVLLPVYISTVEPPN